MVQEDPSILDRYGIISVPNEDTIAAMKEADDMVKHPERYQRFDSMNDLLEVLRG